MVPGELSRALLGPVVPFAAPAQQFLGGSVTGKALWRHFLPSMYGNPCGQIPPGGPSPLSRKFDLGEVLLQAFALAWFCRVEAC